MELIENSHQAKGQEQTEGRVNKRYFAIPFPFSLVLLVHAKCMQLSKERLRSNDQIEEGHRKLFYYALILSPILLVVALMLCIYYVPPVQSLFLSFFSQCADLTPIATVNLVALGIAMILLMTPFAFYEFAVGFACSSYLTPICIVTAAKMIGETASFYLGRQLRPYLQPLLAEFKFFSAVELLTQRYPFKTQLLMRLSGITPQLVMNYGMGVIGSVSFSTFFLVANISGIPSTILSVFIGKQLNRLKDIFSESGTADNQEVTNIELGVCLLGALSIALLVYFVGKEYKKILSESSLQYKPQVDQVETDLELESAI